ncbi:hypothetical protein SDC9_190356 [bioreactor metagenome]|uniref:Uncharacterized protein n=1 Tax=bioreactor metagenome TaxID=1076179 RepID=A0A645HUU7_9ZZZZ
MNDVSYIGFVDSHPESDGGDNHICFLHQEGVLVVAPVGGIHAGVVW